MKTYLIKSESNKKEYKPITEKVRAPNSFLAWLCLTGRDKKGTPPASALLRSAGYKVTKITKNKD